jgi:hypothetical protein
MDGRILVDRVPGVRRSTISTHRIQPLPTRATVDL